MECRCAERGYVRSLEEDDFRFPSKLEQMAETPSAALCRCRACGTLWERLPHWVYGYAWYRIDPRWWASVTAWQENRQTVTA
jgi:hypothetical protein